MEGFLQHRFAGAYIWRGLYMEGLIFGILRYTKTPIVSRKSDCRIIAMIIRIHARFVVQE